MNGFHPLVSIVIPVYNGSNYLREAIESAINQTYDNIEIIIVNDGSTDNTEEIALSFGDRIRYFSKTNGGVSSALNMGICNMHGEYFSWLSHDDLYYPEKIYKQLRCVAESGSKNTIVYCPYHLINERSEIIGKIDPTLLYPRNKLNIPLFPVLKGLIHGCALLIHKNHFDRVGLFDINLRTTQDYFLWFNMFRNTEIRYIPDFLVKSRTHSQQSTITFVNHIDECDALWIYMIDHVTEDEILEMSGSTIQFYKEEIAVLKTTHYKKALGYAEKLQIDYAKQMYDSIISVIIPFKNRIALLLESVKSVQDQTYRNLEIIAVDDNSDDDLDPLFELAAKDKRIRYIKSMRNGAAAARNIGISCSTGKYVAFLDSDDMFLPGKLEIQLKYMLDNGYAFSHTSYHRMKMDGSLLEAIDTSFLSGRAFPRILHSCVVATPTVMAERNLFNRFCFNENYSIGEDVCLWIDISFYNDFGAISQPLTKVRISDTSAFHDTNKQYEGYTTIVKHVLCFKEYLPYRKEISVLLKNAANTIGQTFPRQALYMRFARKIFKILKSCLECMGVKDILRNTGLYRKLYNIGIVDKLNND